MFGINRMFSIEERGRAGRATTARDARVRVILLFVIVVLGILASWFWEIGWKYLADPDPSKVLKVPVLTIIVRVILSFIAAAITFVNVYGKIDQNTQESWIPYFLAFQNGFFWDALFQSVAGTFKN